VFVVEELGAGSLQGDPNVFQDIRLVGDGEGLFDVLFHNEDGCALFFKLTLILFQHFHAF